MPSWLSSENFSLYPPEGRKVATLHLTALREMPASLLPVFLLELKEYDWKFPAEQREIVTRLEFVQANPSSYAAFRSIKIPTELDNAESVKDPQRLLEEMTAYLWSSLQMDAYRKAADRFVELYGTTLKAVPPAYPRLLMICIGREATAPAYPLFQKLRGSGQVWTNVCRDDAIATLLRALHQRSASDPTSYSHWYIDGGSPLPGYQSTCVEQLLYPDLSPVNKQILAIMTSCIKAGSGPEVLQAKLAELTRQIPSAGRVNSNDRMQQFVISLLTQGAGTQIFSTTFVQWATREILRRAQPATILARYAPRQRQKPFNAMVADALATNDLDPDDSLVDADMGAFYAYLELKRLPGADRDRFLIWFEGHPQAFIAAPDIPAGTVVNSQIDMTELLSKMQINLRP